MIGALPLDELTLVLESYELLVSKIWEANNVIETAERNYQMATREFVSAFNFTKSFSGADAAEMYLKNNIRKYIKSFVHDLVSDRKHTWKVIGIIKSKPLGEIFHVLTSIDALKQAVDQAASVLE